MVRRLETRVSRAYPRSSGRSQCTVRIAGPPGLPMRRLWGAWSIRRPAEENGRMRRAITHPLRLGLCAFVVTLALFAVLSSLSGARAPLATATRTLPVLFRPLGCIARKDPVAYRHGPREKVVALSFDDGPSTFTRSFVRMLKANHAVATFFMIGRQVTAEYRATLREELRDGDALGDHTFSHPDLVTSREVRGQLQHTLEAIRGQSGYTPCVFRPPYGDYDQSVLETASSLGMA